jgi:hypothetical protein
MHEMEVMSTILPYRQLTLLQHPNTIEYCNNSYIIPADIPHMEFHISPRSITNPSMNPCNSVVTHNLLTKSIQFCRFSMLHQFLCYVVTANARTYTHNDYVLSSHMQGLMFSVRFSVLNVSLAPRVSWCRELSSGASGSFRYAGCL